MASIDPHWFDVVASMKSLSFPIAKRTASFAELLVNGIIGRLAKVMQTRLFKICKFVTFDHCSDVINQDLRAPKLTLVQESQFMYRAQLYQIF